MQVYETETCKLIKLGGRGVLSYLSYIGMCGLKRYAFLAVLARYRANILVLRRVVLYIVCTLVLNCVGFLVEATFSSLS